MKKSTLALLTLFITLNYAHAQTTSDQNRKEITPPNFLVTRQLTPELIKIEYAASLGSGVFEDNNGMNSSPVKMQSLTVSGYPVTLIGKEHQQLYLGFNYVQNTYTSSDRRDAFSFLDQRYQNLNLNIFLNTRISGNLYWFSYIQWGVSGSSPFNQLSKSHQGILLNKVNYKVSRNMNVGVGVGYSSNQGKPLIIPAITFVYSQPHYLINVDFPVKAELEGIFANGKWRPVVGVSFPSNAYYLRSSDRYLTTSGIAGYIGTSYRILDFLYLHAKWQTGLGETFKVGNRDSRENAGIVSGQSQLVLSLNIQMARLIPAGVN